MRVGLVWAGNPAHKDDHNRSMAPALLAPLLDVDGILAYSLQTARQGEAAAAFGGRVHDLAADLTDYAETAAAIANLDLVIAVDTSVAHLTGALGRPVWTLLPVMPDWRWQLERDDSPWYPTMQLFRQATAGDWVEVVARVRAALARQVEQPRDGPPA